MKTKTIAILSMLPILMLLFAVPTSQAQAPIKIGIMGPLGLIQGDGMKEGAILAKTINGSVLGRPIQLIFSDEFQGQADGTAETGRLAMEYLMAAGCDFVVGGFRTESVLGAREVAADYQKIYLVTGSATNEVIDCGKGLCTQGQSPQWYGGLPATCGAYNYSNIPGGPYGRGLAISYAEPPCGGGLGVACAGASVRCSSTGRYNYDFRVTPVNSTTLVNGVMGIWYLNRQGFLTYGISELKKIFAPTEKLKYAALVENLAWTAGFQKILNNITIPAFGYTDGLATQYMGTDVQKVYYSAIGPTAEDVNTEMQAVKDSGARLLIVVFSAEKAGRAVINAWKAKNVSAIIVGINVIDQMSETWIETSGGCEYESILNTLGTRTPINSLTTQFWDDYLAMWGRAPIYTAFGAYQAVDMLRLCIGRAASLDKDLVRTQLKAYDEVTATGKFKFTANQDLYSVEYGATWGVTDVIRPRSLVIQWQNGREEMVFPRDKSYSIKWRLPVQMYPLWETDLSRDGLVGAADMGQVSNAWLTSPGAGLWNLDADMDSNGLIDIADISRVAKDWLKSKPIPYVP